MGCLCFLPRNYPLLLLGRIVSYRETRGALWLPEFRVDQLDFGGRERAPGEFSEMLQAGIEIQPLFQLFPGCHGLQLREITLGEFRAPESTWFDVHILLFLVVF